MRPRLSVTSIGFVLLTILSIMAFMQGCQFHSQTASQSTPSVVTTGKMVIVGFKPAIAPGGESGPARSPVTGTVFIAAPTTGLISDKLTESLFNKLLVSGEYDLLSPGQARGVFSSLISSGSLLSDVEIAQKIGQAFSAKTVLIGYTYRWKEREGTDYAVNHPASVAFDLYLIRSQDGRVLWKGKFDKTQHSLSENLYDMKTFLKSKGKWMVAEELADHGLESLLATFPKGKGMGED